MGRLLPLLLLAPPLAFGGWLLGHLSRSDEDRVRACIEELLAEWNDLSVRGVTGRLAEDFRAYRDGEPLADREQVGEALRYFYAREGQLFAGTMPWRAELDPGLTTLDLEATGGPRYDVVVRFLRVERPDDEPVWVAGLSGHVVEEDGAWRLLSAEVVTLEGRQLGGRW